MELSKKTTILLPPQLYEHLLRISKERDKSLGQLIRDACEIQYRYIPVEDRVKAVREMGRLSLPVGTPAEMKRQSVPDPKGLLP